MNRTPLKIAICGIGSAGRAREQACLTTEGIILAGLISRREGVGNLDFEQALKDPSLDAVAISTENTDHAKRVEVVLKAGKHVLCDYPLAFTGGRKLYELAKKQDKVLHVEHIGLLTKSHQTAKNELKALGNLVQGHYYFQGSFNDKLQDVKRTGPLYNISLPRLMQLADWFGLFSIEAYEIKQGTSGFSIILKLKFQKGGTIYFQEEHKINLKRKRSFEAQMEKGTYSWNAQLAQEELFKQDLINFRDRILNKAECYYDENLMLEVLDELEKIK